MVAIRRLLGAREAKELLGNGKPRVQQDLAIPAIDYGGDLRGLTLRNADLRALNWTGRLFGHRRMEDCRFEGVDFREVDFRHRAIERVTFVDCVFGDGWGGFDLRLTDVEFARCRWRNLDLDRTTFLRCQVDEVEARDFAMSRGSVMETRMSGSIDNANIRDTTFYEADLSGLRLTRTALVRLSGSVSLPTFTDSFVIRSGVLTEVVGDLDETLSPGARIALHEIAHKISDPDPTAILSIDDTVFTWAPGYVFSDLERQTIRSALYLGHIQGLGDQATFADAD